mmetsp:Transcript_40286/g.127405  ORF Transcript_40286/g.127405 Transcript_40286/m.127405 type:complete len:309 (-) Transcript_40286:238-1164(-)
MTLAFGFLTRMCGALHRMCGALPRLVSITRVIFATSLLRGCAAAAAAGSCAAEDAAAAVAQPDPLLSPCVQLPSSGPPVGTSAHPLLIGASPGTTGTMSLYFALKALGVTTVHYSRAFNATSGEETTSYREGGGPVELLRPLFKSSHPAPPVDREAAHRTDLTYLSATDALIDTPTVDLFFELLAAFPNARVLLTARDPATWAASRRKRHPFDQAPLFPLLGFDAPVGALTEEQAAAAFALWHRVVLGSLPRERVLLLDLFGESSEQLWRRLSAFVGRPLPAAGEDGALPPFPHMQYGDDVELDAGPS